MQKQICVFRVYACTVHRVLNALNQRAVRGQRLSEHQPSFSFIEGGEISECSTDVNGDPEAAFRL